MSQNNDVPPVKEPRRKCSLKTKSSRSSEDIPIRFNQLNVSVPLNQPTTSDSGWTSSEYVLLGFIFISVLYVMKDHILAKIQSSKLK